ncbi:unnamed protein product [Parascedosporium putredinis]|uniref:Cellobiose dehydrogenase-like cytochrome domain-containing protein n=1 Tax=Parascedosporium putredinis TaxID=1442378 RepID=A0A9P1HCL6_9PEZI|nr:unnamed protein product [Parascedosporium putredinis]CAI8004948.1 unnamed protein product [Parascedosporium putredinis]
MMRWFARRPAFSTLGGALLDVVKGKSVVRLKQATPLSATGLTYKDFSTPNGIAFRIAIPDAAAAPFDVAIQIVAPKAVGWAGLAWGGTMANCPLTIAYPNGETVTASSRTASGHQAPTAYAAAEYTILPGTTVNATHWVLDAVCKGCSQWSGRGLNPAGSSPLAWAFAPDVVSNPSSDTAPIGYHNQNKAVVNFDFAAAKVPNFAEAIAGGAGGDGGPAEPRPTRLRPRRLRPRLPRLRPLLPTSPSSGRNESTTCCDNPTMG